MIPSDTGGMSRLVTPHVAHPLLMIGCACAGLVCAVLVVGCGPDPAEEAPTAQVSAIDEAERTFDAAVGSSYEITFEFVGSASVGAGPVRVEVVNGEVVDADYPEPILESVLTSVPLRTVAEMFDRARITLEQGGLVEVTFDESYGHPTVLTIDPVPDAIDDEYSVRVISVEPSALPDGDGY